MKYPFKKDMKSLFKCNPFKYSSIYWIWYVRFYSEYSDSRWLLTYSNQLEFKKYAKKIFGLDDTYYFDDVDCVDDRTQHNIPFVKCDGTLTWGEAVDILKKHFGVKTKLSDSKTIKRALENTH